VSQMGTASAVDEYSCPVCGIALIEADLDEPEGEYFCPYCSTELRPLLNELKRSSS